MPQFPLMQNETYGAALLWGCSESGYAMDNFHPRAAKGVFYPLGGNWGCVGIWMEETWGNWGGWRIGDALSLLVALGQPVMQVGWFSTLLQFWGFIHGIEP